MTSLLGSRGSEGGGAGLPRRAAGAGWQRPIRPASPQRDPVELARVLRGLEHLPDAASAGPGSATPARAAWRRGGCLSLPGSGAPPMIARIQPPASDPQPAYSPADGKGAWREAVVLGDWLIVREAESIPRARRRIAGLAARVPGCLEISGDIELMASELLANAVLHGSGEKIQVRVFASGPVVLVEIRDSGGSPRCPAPDADPLGEHGRGLLIVAALAHRWGLEHNIDGTTAWFEARPGTARP